MTPCCKEDLLKVNIKEYLNPNSYLGYEFEERLKIIRNKISTDTEKVIRRICVNFIVCLVTQLQSRLPSNLNILKNISIFSPEKCLNVIRPSIVALAEGMDFLVEDVGKMQSQWEKLNLVKWNNTMSTSTTEQLWAEINMYRDSSGLNPFQEIVTLAKCFLILPWSNSDVERVFSQLSIIKTKHRNRMLTDTTNAIITVKSGLRRLDKCCHSIELPKDILMAIGNYLNMQYL